MFEALTVPKGVLTMQRKGQEVYWKVTLLEMLQLFAPLEFEQALLWYLRMGHTSELCKTEISKLQFCKHFILGQQTRQVSKTAGF